MCPVLNCFHSFVSSFLTLTEHPLRVHVLFHTGSPNWLGPDCENIYVLLKSYLRRTDCNYTKILLTVFLLDRLSWGQEGKFSLSSDVITSNHPASRLRGGERDRLPPISAEVSRLTDSDWVHVRMWTNPCDSGWLCLDQCPCLEWGRGTPTKPGDTGGGVAPPNKQVESGRVGS